jgi:hypothetical protein
VPARLAGRNARSVEHEMRCALRNHLDREGERGDRASRKGEED